MTSPPGLPVTTPAPRAAVPASFPPALALAIVQLIAVEVQRPCFPALPQTG